MASVHDVCRTLRGTPSKPTTKSRSGISTKGSIDDYRLCIISDTVFSRGRIEKPVPDGNCSPDDNSELDIGQSPRIDDLSISL